MIETLSIVLQKILLMKKTNNIDGAISEINLTAQKLIGLELKHFRTFSDSRIIEMMLLEKDTAPIKLYVTGVLLKEEASLSRMKKLDAESEDLNIKALSLLLESYLIDLKPVVQNHTSLIDEIIGFFKNDEIPGKIPGKIFLFYENLGLYGKAEDILFELAEVDSSYTKTGIDFYERLLKKSDEELAKGNLPRIEVEEALMIFKTKWAAGNY